MTDFELYKQNYIEVVNNYKSGKTDISINKVFEYLVAIELKLLLCEDFSFYNYFITFNEDYKILINDHKCALVVTDIDRVTYEYCAPYIVNVVRYSDISNIILVIDENVKVDISCEYLFNKVIRFNKQELLNGDSTRELVNIWNENKSQIQTKKLRTAKPQPPSPKPRYRKGISHLNKSK